MQQRDEIHVKFHISAMRILKITCQNYQADPLF